MKRLLLATTNTGKIVEMKECLSGLPFHLLTLSDLPHAPPQPHEGGASHTENAVLKARYYFDHVKIPTIAEDSGIHVEALAGELGIETRRWGAGPSASDAEWIAYFLKRMKKEKNKRAYFHCVVAYCDGGETKTFEGKCEGVITDTLESSYLPGLPISACFRPDGFSAVFSALSLEQKNSSSHRGRAMQKARDFLGKTPL